jgi:hypothetical protein
MVFSLAVAAFAAAAVVVSTWIVVKLQRESVREADVKLSAAAGEAANANKKAAEANERAAKLENETAAARLETLRVKQQMAWRQVSVEQAKILANELRGKQIEVWLTFVGNDPESTVFREELNQALTAAGVKTIYFSGYAMAVGTSISNNARPERDLLITAFRKAGIPLIQSDKPGFSKDGKVEIIVGTKPPPV